MARLALPRVLGLVAISVAFALGCGGAAEGDPDGSTGGASGSGAVGTVSGGANNTGGRSVQGGANASGGAATGGSSAQGGSQSCCLALAVCDAGDRTLSGPSACSANGSCYSRSICCDTVWCERGAQCDAIPVCDPGDVQVSGECPPEVAACYSRSLCGTTIFCRSVTGAGGSSGVGGNAGTAGAGGADGEESCDPASEHNRDYVGTSPGACAAIRYTCSGRTAHFANTCGCGCEQDASCPRVVDCTPGAGTPNPLCSVDGQAQCPYTLRAL